MAYTVSSIDRSIACKRGLRDGNPDLAIVANCSGVQREHGIAGDIRRDGFTRRGMRPPQLVPILEDRFYDSIDKVVREVPVRNGEIVKPERMIILGQGPVCSGREQGWCNFGQLLSHAGNLLLVGWDEINQLPGIQLGEHRSWSANCGSRAVDVAGFHLRRGIFPRAVPYPSCDPKGIENRGDVGAARPRARTAADPQPGEFGERFDFLDVSPP
jgi:hypothetical protein